MANELSAASTSRKGKSPARGPKTSKPTNPPPSSPTRTYTFNPVNKFRALTRDLVRERFTEVTKLPDKGEESQKRKVTAVNYAYDLVKNGFRAVAEKKEAGSADQDAALEKFITDHRAEIIMLLDYALKNPDQANLELPRTPARTARAASRSRQPVPSTSKSRTSTPSRAGKRSASTSRRPASRSRERGATTKKRTKSPARSPQRAIAEPQQSTRKRQRTAQVTSPVTSPISPIPDRMKFQYAPLRHSYLNDPTFWIYAVVAVVAIALLYLYTPADFFKRLQKARK